MIYELKMVMSLKACLLPSECLPVNSPPHLQTEQNRFLAVIGCLEVQ